VQVRLLRRRVRRSGAAARRRLAAAPHRLPRRSLSGTRTRTRRRCVSAAPRSTPAARAHAQHAHARARAARAPHRAGAVRGGHRRLRGTSQRCVCVRAWETERPFRRRAPRRGAAHSSRARARARGRGPACGTPGGRLGEGGSAVSEHAQAAQVSFRFSALFAVFAQAAPQL
jgi:hypothetical protein